MKGNNCSHNRNLYVWIVSEKATKSWIPRFRLNRSIEEDLSSDDSVELQEPSGSLYVPSELSSFQSMDFSGRAADAVSASEVAPSAPPTAPTDGPAANLPKPTDQKLNPDEPPPAGYKVIVPSPSKRMQELRAKQPESKKKGASYHLEMTGDNQDKIAAYLWPDAPDKWSTIEPGEDRDSRYVDGQLVSKPQDCSFATVEGDETDDWIISPNLAKNGVCGSGEERDVARYGQTKDFSEGDLLLVPDGKRSQFYDGGWYTGENKQFPEPYNKCVLLEWADTHAYSGNRLNTKAWRGVWVPTSRLVKAPDQKRSHIIKAGEKRGAKADRSKNKPTMEQISKMTFGAAVVFKGNAPYALFGRNTREVSVAVRPIDGSHQLVGTEDDIIYFYLEQLDPVTDFTNKMAKEYKQSLHKLILEKGRKRRAEKKQKDKTEVDPRLINKIQASSFHSSPAGSEAAFRLAGSHTTTSTPNTVRTPDIQLAKGPLPTGAMQNLGPVLAKTSQNFPAFGVPSAAGFTESDFWKHEAHAFMGDTELSFQQLTILKQQLEQMMTTMISVSDNVRLGVLSNLELTKKNQELFEKNSATASQVAALAQTLPKLFNARSITEGTPKSPKLLHAPQTAAYLGETVLNTLTATTPLSYRTTIYSTNSKVDDEKTPVRSRSVALENSSNVTRTPGQTQSQSQPLPGRAQTQSRQLANTTSSQSPATGRASPAQLTSPDTEPAVLAITKSSTIPSRPASPWSTIDLNTQYLKNHPKWNSVRQQACLQLGRLMYEHEWPSVKWLFWCDSRFDAFNTFNTPQEFERFLAIVAFSKAKNNGTGLDGKTITSYLANYKSKTTLSPPASSNLPISLTKCETPVLNKAELKALSTAAPKIAAPKQSHRRKRKASDSGSKIQSKRGMRSGGTRKAADPKLKEPWKGRGEATAYDPVMKTIWRKEHLDHAVNSVQRLQQRSTVYKQYRFVEKLLKQMVEAELTSTVIDFDDLKHTVISLRNALRKAKSAGARAQEDICMGYHFYWAAMELYKDKFPHSWHVGPPRDNAQLEVCEKVAAIAKAWCTDTEGAKKPKLAANEPVNEEPQPPEKEPEPKIKDTKHGEKDEYDLSFDAGSASAAAAIANASSLELASDDSSKSQKVHKEPEEIDEDDDFQPDDPIKVPTDELPQDESGTEAVNEGLVDKIRSASPEIIFEHFGGNGENGGEEVGEDEVGEDLKDKYEGDEEMDDLESTHKSPEAYIQTSEDEDSSGDDQ